MVRLLKHFHIPFSKLRLECLSSSLEGQFHRSNHIQVDPFTSDQKRVVDMAIEKADKIIRGRNGRGMPLYLYKYT